MDDSSQEPVSLPPDKLMRIYAKMREKLEVLQRDLDKVENDMKVVKSALLDHCKANGVESIRTPYGLAYRVVRTMYSTADWENFHKFVLENQAPYLLEKRLHQGNMKEFLADNPELVPPGLNSSSEYTITIKRK
jgi:hypothetical protein